MDRNDEREPDFSTATYVLTTAAEYNRLSTAETRFLNAEQQRGRKLLNTLNYTRGWSKEKQAENLREALIAGVITSQDFEYAWQRIYKISNTEYHRRNDRERRSGDDLAARLRYEDAQTHHEAYINQLFGERYTQTQEEQNVEIGQTIEDVAEEVRQVETQVPQLAEGEREKFIRLLLHEPLSKLAQEGADEQAILSCAAEYARILERANIGIPPTELLNIVRHYAARGERIGQGNNVEVDAQVYMEPPDEEETGSVTAGDVLDAEFEEIGDEVPADADTDRVQTIADENSGNRILDPTGGRPRARRLDPDELKRRREEAASYGKQGANEGSKKPEDNEDIDEEDALLGNAGGLDMATIDQLKKGDS